jgi:putative holliday junction resolvase
MVIDIEDIDDMKGIQKATRPEIRKRFMGIDFGTKRIGLAISDDMAKMAFPKTVIENRPGFLDEIVSICLDNGIDTVVLGESRDFQGRENTIMKKTEIFKTALENKGLSVIYEPEVLSTVQAQQFQGQNKDLDASSAAIILQSYLDRLGHQANVRLL